MAAFGALILLPLSTLMPPKTVPVSTMPPLSSVLLTTSMPPAPIVPVLVTPPLKVVALITMALVTPLNLVGYGPINGTATPQRPGGPARSTSPLALQFWIAPPLDLKSTPAALSSRGAPHIPRRILR